MVSIRSVVSSPNLIFSTRLDQHLDCGGIVPTGHFRGVEGLIEFFLRIFFLREKLRQIDDVANVCGMFNIMSAPSCCRSKICAWKISVGEQLFPSEYFAPANFPSYRFKNVERVLSAAKSEKLGLLAAVYRGSINEFP